MTQFEEAQPSRTLALECYLEALEKLTPCSRRPALADLGSELKSALTAVAESQAELRALLARVDSLIASEATR